MSERLTLTPSAPTEARVHPIDRPHRAAVRREHLGRVRRSELVGLAEAAGLDSGVLVDSWRSGQVLDRVRRRVEAEGMCTGRHVDREAFFPTVGSESARGQLEAEAAQLCAGCPVARMCLTWAVATGQDYGVWGGRAQHQVRALARRFAALTPRASKAGAVLAKRSA